MSNTIIQKIKKTIDEHPRTFQSFICKDSEIMEFVKTYPEQLSTGGYTLKTKLYWIYHDINDFPTYVCPVDGVVQSSKGMNIDRFHIGYDKWLNRAGCSLRCVQLNPKTKDKIKSTCQDKYGCDCVQHSTQWKNNVKKTCQERFGSDTPFGSKEILDKCKKTLIDKTGFDNPMKCESTKLKVQATNEIRYGGKAPSCSKDVRDKMFNTNMERYGVSIGGNSEDGRKKAKETFQRHCKENPNFTSEIHQKIVNTNLTLHGVEDYANSEEINEKRRQTNLNKFGVEYSFQREDVKKKSKKTCMEKYGVEYFTQSNEFKALEASKTTYRQISYRNFILTCQYDSPMFTEEEYVKGNSEMDFKFICKTCGKTFTSIHRNGKHKRCPICYPELNGLSIGEDEVYTHICQSIDKTNVQSGNRLVLGGKELDIYIPERKLAFEYDGLYWHSQEWNSDKNYHLWKTNECEKQGIHLIHIFENEWIGKQNIVKSRINNLFGIYDKVVYARKCEVKEVSSNESFEFQCQNHIQGGIHSSVNIGLYYKNELVSLMTFSKPRFSKKYEYELVRFCNKLGYHIPGGASKLLKYFELNYNPKSLVSYADRRWTMNSGSTTYDKLGFKLNSISSPNYWYWKNHSDKATIELESRVKYQKHKLKNILEHFDESKSEWENMKDNGFNRIFDCGNLVYVKEF